MQYTATDFKDLWILSPDFLSDHRGYFYESFNQRNFEKATGLSPQFVQDNQSRSEFGVMRGLHFQKESHGQAKLVRVLSGVVQDVVLDMRPNEKTFGKHFSIVLDAEKQQQLFVPRGFAHGFLVLSEEAEFTYKCDNFYAPEFESGVLFNDPKLNIPWQLPENKIITSEKDLILPTLANATYND